MLSHALISALESRDRRINLRANKETNLGYMRNDKLPRNSVVLNLWDILIKHLPSLKYLRSFASHFIFSLLFFLISVYHDLNPFCFVSNYLGKSQLHTSISVSSLSICMNFKSQYVGCLKHIMNGQTKKVNNWCLLRSSCGLQLQHHKTGETSALKNVLCRCEVASRILERGVLALFV